MSKKRAALKWGLRGIGLAVVGMAGVLVFGAYEARKQADAQDA